MTVPEEIHLVQEFANTLDEDTGTDELATPDDVKGWFAARGLLSSDATVDYAGWQRTLEVRRGIRALALVNGGGPASPEAVAGLNRGAHRHPLVVRWSEEGSASVVPGAEGIDGALAAILGSMYRAMAEGTWERLKACAEGSCRWVFYDLSKNHSGKWCSMAVCGNRAKARTYREARRTD